MPVWNYNPSLSLWFDRAVENWMIDREVYGRTWVCAKTWGGVIGVPKKGTPYIDYAHIWADGSKVMMEAHDSKGCMGVVAVGWGNIWAWRDGNRVEPQPDPVSIDDVYRVSVGARRGDWRRKGPWWKPWHTSFLVDLWCWEPVAKAIVMVDFYISTAGDPGSRSLLSSVWYWWESGVFHLIYPLRPWWVMPKGRWYTFNFDPRLPFKLAAYICWRAGWGVRYKRLQLIEASPLMELQRAEGKLDVDYFYVYRR